MKKTKHITQIGLDTKQSETLASQLNVLLANYHYITKMRVVCIGILKENISSNCIQNLKKYIQMRKKK